MIENILFYLHNIYMSSFNYFEKGGILMIPILILSVIIWILIAERCLFFKGEVIHTKNIYLAYINSKVNHNIESKVHKSILFKVIQNIFLFPTTNKELQLKILNEKILEVVPKIEKNLLMISVLTAVAPLLGLLGTVFGLVTTFDIISSSVSIDPRSIATGISEALITTETGLIIAIPGYFFSKKLNRKSEKIKQQLYSLNHFINEVKK